MLQLNCHVSDVFQHRSQCFDAASIFLMYKTWSLVLTCCSTYRLRATCLEMDWRLEILYDIYTVHDSRRFRIYNSLNIWTSVHFRSCLQNGSCSGNNATTLSPNNFYTWNLLLTTDGTCCTTVHTVH